MPWYAFTALPLLALRRPNLLSWTVALYSSLVLLGEQYPSLSADDDRLGRAPVPAERAAGRRAGRAASS